MAEFTRYSGRTIKKYKNGEIELGQISLLAAAQRSSQAEAGGSGAD